MIYRYCTDENYLGDYKPVTYEITTPVRLRVRTADGQVVLMGYGIGERIQIVERESVCAVAHAPKLKTEIPLADGGTIIEFPVENFCRRKECL